MEERLEHLREQLSAAIVDFERGLAIDARTLEPTLADLARSGQAQKFEFTIELFWKTVKVFLLNEHGFDVGSPKGAIKKYFELGQIDYEGCERLLKALDIRNSLSHVYRKESFLALHEEILSYRGFFERAAAALR